MRKGLPTVMELVKKTADFFAAEGIASARLDAEVLLADVLGLDRIHLYVNFDRPLEEAEVDRYRQAVIRRFQRCRWPISPERRSSCRCPLVSIPRC